MIIYGVAILAFCFVSGQLVGELLGNFLGINANVGGVGFAMLLLMLINNWLQKKGLLDKITESGIEFWSKMYIPIIVAMAATQNVRVAVSSGLLAILAGIIPVAICLMAIPYISKLSNTKND
jgi:malonate transporter MadL subunit